MDAELKAHFDQIGKALRSQRDANVTNKAAIMDMITRFDALEKHVATLTATSINAARNASSAPRWYKPWMGGVLLGLVLVILFAMTLGARNEAAKANAWTAKADSQCVNTQRVLDSLRFARSLGQEATVMRPRKSKRPDLGVDAGAAANPGNGAAAVSTGASDLGGVNQ